MLKQQADLPRGGRGKQDREGYPFAGCHNLYLEPEKWSLGEGYQSSKQNLCWVVMKEEEVR